jgi:hypothetical protein
MRLLVSGLEVLAGRVPDAWLEGVRINSDMAMVRQGYEEEVLRLLQSPPTGQPLTSDRRGNLLPEKTK